MYFPESPSFIKTPSPVEGIVGKDASLHCEMYGTPPFDINWYKDRRPLKESRKYKMVSEGSSATLHIMRLEQEDTGHFECRVSNNVGSESCRTTITLKGSYRISEPFPQSSVLVRSHLLIFHLSITVQNNQCLSRSWSTNQ